MIKKIKMMMEKKINISGTVRSLEPGDSVEFTNSETKRNYLYSLCSFLKEDRGWVYTVNKIADGRYRVTRVS